MRGEIQRDGLRIAFSDRGEGPPLVLAHSFLCSGEMWEPQLAALEARHRVVNVDLRGHGASGAATERCSLYDLVGDHLTVLDELGIDSAAWAGLSIGGMIAIRAALVAPERVSALALLDTHAGAERPWPKLKYRAMAAWARLFGLRALVPAVLPLFFSAATRREQPELVADYGARFRALHVPSTLKVLGSLTRRDSVVERLGEIAVPTLAVVGAEDASLPPPLSRQIADGISDAELLVVPEAGHLSSLERPDVVTPALVEFLASRAHPTPL